MPNSSIPGEGPALRRGLNLPLAVLFGLGVTIGAGIYVLIGATAARAGMHAPLAFVIAALVMLPTAASFAELASRMPVSAGEAAYVQAGFGTRWLTLVVGLLVIGVGVISAAAISHGASGYIQQLTGMPLPVIVPLVVLAMAAVAAWGIVESVTAAAIMTLIEIAGLVAIVVVGFASSPAPLSRLPEVWTGIASVPVLSGIFSSALLAFFAFIGFEGLANIAEEVKNPGRTLPRAIFLTLVISTLLYILVVWVALVGVPREELAASRAPLSLVFRRVTGMSPVLITAIAVIATINGIIVQMVMASRVIYGMADQGALPKLFAEVHPATRTPLKATALTAAIVLLLAVLFPLEWLAEMTSRISLTVFALVNAALYNMKRGRRPDDGTTGFKVAAWVPLTGLLLCLGLLLADALT